eukprot:12088442-Karenia_brevis.AAC.1
MSEAIILDELELVNLAEMCSCFRRRAPTRRTRSDNNHDDVDPADPWEGDDDHHQHADDGSDTDIDNTDSDDDIVTETVSRVLADDQQIGAPHEDDENEEDDAADFFKSNENVLLDDSVEEICLLLEELEKSVAADDSKTFDDVCDEFENALHGMNLEDELECDVAHLDETHLDDVPAGGDDEWEDQADAARNDVRSERLTPPPPHTSSGTHHYAHI